MNNKVTIIIASFNHGRYIFRALESVINQSHRNIEVLIIDDGSTDNTFDVVSGLIKMIAELNIFINTIRGFRRQGI